MLVAAKKRGLDYGGNPHKEPVEEDSDVYSWNKEKVLTWLNESFDEARQYSSLHRLTHEADIPNLKRVHVPGLGWIRNYKDRRANRMNCLLVGGAGFIGRALARQLESAGYVAMIADSLEVHPADQSVVRETRNIEADVRLYDHVRLLLQDGRPDAVFWLAAKQGYDRDWSRFGQVNVAAAYNLFQALCETDLRPKVILTSSQAVYEPALDVTENHPHGPPSIYGLSKSQQEEAFLAFLAQPEFRDVRLAILRPSIVLGAGQSLASSESGVLRNWLRATRTGAHPQIYGDGTHERDFVDVEDVARAHVAALRWLEGGELSTRLGIFNVGGFPLSILELFSIFRRETRCADAEVLGHDVRPGGEYSLTSSSDLATEELDWHPTVPIGDQVRAWLESAELGERADSPAGVRRKLARSSFELK